MNVMPISELHTFFSIADLYRSKFSQRLRESHYSCTFRVFIATINSANLHDDSTSTLANTSAKRASVITIN